MEKLGQIIKKAFSYPALLRKTHPVTAVSIIISTMILAADSYAENIQVLEYLGLSFACFSVFALCLESIRPNWSTPVRLVVLALLLMLSIIIGFIGRPENGRSDLLFYTILDSIKDRLGTYTVTAVSVGLICIAFLIAIYFSYSRDIDQNFNEHVLNACSGLFFTSIIYGVIQIGVLLLTAIVSVLLYDDAFRFLPPILILINGLFYVPAALITIIRKNEQANMFIQILVRYILLILVSIAYVIIYIYMLKLVITLSVPSNSVYGILTALFVISMLVAYLCTPLGSDGFLQKIAFNMPLIFAPFIIMQVYTVTVRISQYGITPKRYFGLIFILFEIVYIIAYSIYRRDHEIIGRDLLLIVCFFAVIGVFIPGINAEAVSVTMARHTLGSYLDKQNSGVAISDKEYMRANAAYDFLGNSFYKNSKTSRYFEDLSEDTVSLLRSRAGEAAAIANASEQSDPSNLWFSCTLDQAMGNGYIDISGYKGMQYIHIQDGRLDTPVDAAGKTYTSIDLDDYASAIIEPYMQYEHAVISWDEYMEKATPLGCIDIDENARLYITDADITLENGKPVSSSVNGFLFIR